MGEGDQGSASTEHVVLETAMPVVKSIRKKHRGSGKEAA